MRQVRRTKNRSRSAVGRGKGLGKARTALYGPEVVLRYQAGMDTKNRTCFRISSH